MLIQPDTGFIRTLIKTSPDLKECMQCGNCSVVCSLSPEDRPFPRKEMIWAGWGLREKLMASPDIWLCHQCGDCSAWCPRGVKPADVLASVRNNTYLYYARPKFLGKILNNPALLPVAILIPVLIISLIILSAGTFSIPEGPVNYSKFFPHAWLNGSFTAITFLIVSFTFSGLLRYRKNLKKQLPEPAKKSGILKSLIALRKDIILHTNFSGCETQKSRKLAHILVFYGFIMLLAVTLYAIFAAITGRYPLTFRNPFKVAGNLSAIMLATGLGIMIVNRLFHKNEYGKSTYSDWLFLISLLLLTVSGVVVEAARFLNWSSAYHIYFFHLVLVWFIVIYAPYTKFGHFIYRIAALVFIKTRSA